MTTIQHQNPLTPHQKQVLQLVAEEKNIKTIAYELGQSPKTVEYHKTEIKQKLGIVTDIGLFKYAVRIGLAVMCWLVCCGGFAAGFIKLPTIQTDIIIASTNVSITLGWSPSVGADEVGYRIYWGVTSGKYTNSATVGNVTNVTLTQLLKGTTYYFAVKGYIATGEEGPFSNEITNTYVANTIMRIPAETNSASGLTDWKFSHYIWQATNPVGSGFWRLRDAEIISTNGWQ